MEGRKDEMPVETLNHNIMCIKHYYVSVIITHFGSVQNVVTALTILWSSRLVMREDVRCKGK